MGLAGWIGAGAAALGGRVASEIVKNEAKKKSGGSSKKSGSSSGSVPKTGAEQADLINSISRNYKSGNITAAQRDASIQDVLDGKSIYDPGASYNSGAGSNRPSSSSSGGGGGYRTSGGGYTQTVTAPSSSDYYKDFLELYEQNEREVQAAKEASERLLNSQKQGQLSSINSLTSDAQQQAYIARMQAEKNLGANLRGAGLSGGMAESTGLGVQTAYQGILSDLEKNRVNAANEMGMAHDERSLQNAIAFADKILANNQNRMSTMYNLYRDQVGDQRYANEWNYQTGRDQVSDARYADQWAYQQAQDALQNQRYEAEWDYGAGEDNYNRALQQAQTLAAYGNFSGYRALGYTEDQIADMERAYGAQRAGGGSARSGGSGAGSGGGAGGGMDYDGLFAAARRSGNAQSYIANNYKRFGFTSSSGLFNDYKAWSAAPDDAAVTNPHSEDWIQVGGGRMTWNELMAQVEAGRIEEIYDPASGAITYRKK